MCSVTFHHCKLATHSLIIYGIKIILESRFSLWPLVLEITLVKNVFGPKFKTTVWQYEMATAKSNILQISIQIPCKVDFSSINNLDLYITQKADVTIRTQ